MPKIGISNIRVIILFGLAIGQKVANALEDGKVNFVEVISFTPEITKIPNVAEAVKRAPAEFLDLDESEKLELVTMVQKEFDLDNDTVEEAIEESFDFALSGLRYGLRMSKIFKKKAA